MKKRPEYRETHIRQPTPIEAELGLWVDRIGRLERNSALPPTQLRRLGQYSVVAVEVGVGWLYRASERPVRVHQGDVILHRPEEALNYRSVAGWTTRWVVWNGPEAAKLEALQLFPPTCAIFPGAAAMVVSVWRVLEPLMERKDAVAALRRKRLVLDLVLGLAQNATEGKSPHENSDAFTQQVTAWLRERPAGAVSVSELARRFHLSAPHFRRVFRARTGRSPIEFINTWRIGQAQQLLQQGATIKDTAAQTGFRDIFYFMRVFKKVTGLTAGEFGAHPAHLP